MERLLKMFGFLSGQPEQNQEWLERQLYLGFGMYSQNFILRNDGKVECLDKLSNFSPFNDTDYAFYLKKLNEPKTSTFYGWNT